MENQFCLHYPLANPWIWGSQLNNLIFKFFFFLSLGLSWCKVLGSTTQPHSKPFHPLKEREFSMVPAPSYRQQTRENNKKPDQNMSLSWLSCPHHAPSRMHWSCPTHLRRSGTSGSHWKGAAPPLCRETRTTQSFKRQSLHPKVHVHPSPCPEPELLMASQCKMLHWRIHSTN